jgi:PTS system ascorbate-specific IIB component
MAASILCCCANGSGTSLMMAMTLEKVIKAQGYKITKTHHCSLSEGKNSSIGYDIVICPQNFTNMFEMAEKKGVKVIGMRNVMSAKEMTEKLETCGVDLK